MTRLLLTLLLAAAIAALTTAPSSARTWSGKVIHVDDGDTMDVRIDGRVRQVRFIAVQAMELTRYSTHPSKRRGECHGLEATARLEQIIRRAGSRVRLTASRAGLVDHKGRLRRSVAVRQGGAWRDVGTMLVREGHALWLPALDERKFNPSYNRLQQQAALKGTNLWDPDHCGSGPNQDVPLRIWANSDLIGNDDGKANAEFIKVRNLSPAQSVSLGGWWVRDSNLRRFVFPAGTTIAPGETATVHTGSGVGANAFSWRLPEPIFENVDDGRDLGDGAYLFDPKGDLRATMLYPCVVSCSDPNLGKLDIEARAQRPETVTVRNTSAAPIELYGYQLTLPGSSWPFPENAVVPAGGTYKVDIAEWDNGRYLLPDPGGWIRLKTFTEITLACDAWGSGVCS